ncbi:MAG: NYN domain-containing protein [Helicobacter sp.]|nr:NYN domain-containing protein [Helicobacter sp.]
MTYIDGFNLYHSIKALSKQDCSLEYLKWQNLPKLAQQFLSRNDEIIKIYFFTAYPYWKPKALQNHRNYVAILQDLGVNVIFGHFKTRKSYCSNCKTYTESHEEKQTDVNIAMQILKDSYEQTHDMVQIISGDTDLVPPIKLARNEGKIINIVLPPRRKSKEFIQNYDKTSNRKIKHL